MFFLTFLWWIVCIFLSLCSFLCRSVSVDDMKRVAIFTVSTNIEIQLIAERSSFFLVRGFFLLEFTLISAGICVHCKLNCHLQNCVWFPIQHKVFLIPRARFTMEYLKPRVHCISTHGHFSPDRWITRSFWES